MKYSIALNLENGQFEVVMNNEVIGLINYSLAEEGSILVITHTEVNPEYEGKGIAGAMTKYVLEYAKENNLKILPICSYTKAYIERHPEYQGLLK